MHKNQKNIFPSFLATGIIIALFIMPRFVLTQAQTIVPNPNPNTTVTNPVSMNIKIDNPFNQNSIESFIRTIINNILMPIGGVLAVMMIIYAGFKYVTARGNTTKIGEAHRALLWAVVGAAILLGAWVISTAIQGTINELRSG